MSSPKDLDLYARTVIGNVTLSILLCTKTSGSSLCWAGLLDTSFTYCCQSYIQMRALNVVLPLLSREVLRLS